MSEIEQLEQLEQKHNTKAKGVIFDTEDVRAILNNRKTQFIKLINIDESKYSFDGFIECEGAYFTTLNPKEYQTECIKPKYKTGDILYVRETFVRGALDADCSVSPTVTFYKADGDIDWVNSDLEDVNTPWKPPIYMPKEYARIFLKVTDVKVERLQNMTFNDIFKEGCSLDISNDIFTKNLNIKAMYCAYKLEKDVTRWFVDIWNLKAKKGFKWEDNPYIFVYEFEIQIK